MTKESKLELEKQRIAEKQAKQNKRLAEIEKFLSTSGNQISVVD